jgi:hypothetical protein
MKTIGRLCFSLILIFSAVSFAQSNPRDMLGLFIGFGEKDSIAGITDADSTIIVEIINTETKVRRTEMPAVNAMQKEKILKAYKEYSAAAPGETSQRTAEMEPDNRDISSQRKNHIGYVSTQTTVAYYVYSLAWPIGFDLGSETATAMSLITIPICFGGHYLFQKKYPLHDAQIQGINYLTLGYLALTYSIPFAFSTDDGLWDAFRLSAVLSMATYPLGIYSGYKLGLKNENNPGRIDFQSLCATSGYLLGVCSPMVYLGDNIGERYGRTFMLGSAVVFSIAGHYLGNLYKKDQIIPRGNPAGISSIGILGLMVGATIDSWIQTDNLNLNVGIPWATFAGGLAAGMYVFQDRRDLLERGKYNALGLSAGLAAASGINLLINPYDVGTMMTILTAGAFSGYFLTNHLTRDLVEKSEVKAEKSSSFDFCINMMPQTSVKRYLGKSYMKYSLAPLVVRF